MIVKYALQDNYLTRIPAYLIQAKRLKERIELNPVEEIISIPF